MSQINLQINFNPKVVISLLVTVAAGLLVYKIPETRAQATTITGKFGCIGNTNSSPYLVAKAGQDAWVNSLSYIDFDSMTASDVSAVLSNFNVAQTSQRNDVTSNLSFTLGGGPITGSYTLTFSNGAKYTVMPVNSGNTLLSVTSTTGRDHMVDTGVCQKI